MLLTAKLPFLLERPSAIIDPVRVRANLATMAMKAKSAGVRFRPHVKTHFSAKIGLWLKAAGVEAITVSSVQMAEYFAEAGWGDITIAVPVNLPEIPRMNKLAGKIKLSLLADSVVAIAALDNELEHPVDLWLKIDVGYHRVGLHWKDHDNIYQFALAARAAEKLNFAGLLTHAGQTYSARSDGEITEIANQSIERIKAVHNFLHWEDFPDKQISFGDTPSCSVMQKFPDIDEIRPGNFIFYDLVQEQIGACDESHIAIAIACPVIGIYPDRGQVAIYGGAVHLSKDSIIVDNQKVFGHPMTLNDKKFGTIVRQAKLVSISQEHGLLEMPSDMLKKVNVGDTILIAPAHSCLAADMHSHYMTTDGEKIERFS